jgi:hypothetical protein
MPKTLNDIEAKHIRWFVIGACVDYNNQVRMFDNNRPLQRMQKKEWMERVQVAVNRYLENPSMGPGADCSDFEANLILETRKVFDLYPPKVIEGGICEHCGEPNMDHMGGPCHGQIRRHR